MRTPNLSIEIIHFGRLPPALFQKGRN